MLPLPHHPPLPHLQMPACLDAIYFQDITLCDVHSHHPQQLNLPLPGVHCHNQPGACPEPAKLVLMLAHEEIYSFPAQLTLVWAQLGLSPPLPPPHTHAHELSVELVPISFLEGKLLGLCPIQPVNPRGFQNVCIIGTENLFPALLRATNTLGMWSYLEV